MRQGATAGVYIRTSVPDRINIEDSESLPVPVPVPFLGTCTNASNSGASDKGPGRTGHRYKGPKWRLEQRSSKGTKGKTRISRIAGGSRKRTCPRHGLCGFLGRFLRHAGEIRKQTTKVSTKNLRGPKAPQEGEPLACLKVPVATGRIAAACQELPRW
jgi:hypothetical protein